MAFLATHADLRDDQRRPMIVLNGHLPERIIQTGIGALQVIQSDQYEEAFDVGSKLECIRALIPLGLMHVQEVLEEEV